jgi:hypothetical protein
MEALMNFSHRYLAPFVTGVCIAGATVAGDVPALVALILAAGFTGYISLPAGGRWIKRLSGVAS